MSVLIAFGSIEGQTRKVAHFVEALAKDAGLDVSVHDTSDRLSNVSFDGVDQVILAASVHERRHPKDFELFVSANHDHLEERKTLLLSISLNAAFPGGQQEAQDYMDEMKLRTQLEPTDEALVAGAVRKRSYDYYATQILQHVVLRGRNIDPSVQEHEFTDWDALAMKVSTFLNKV